MNKKDLRTIDSLPDDAIVEVEEVAAWLRMKVAWVRDHASGRRAPYLPSIKMGKYLRFHCGTLRQTVADWQKKRTRQQSDAA